VPIIEVHASRGKATRAEPVAALYEQRRVVHVGAADRFEKLERQMVEWDPTQRVSPDRVDALVWAVTDLALGPQVSLDGYAEANEELSTVQRPRLPGEMTDRPYHEEDFEQPVGPSGWGGTLG
jgi:hypothetical protein